MVYIKHLEDGTILEARDSAFDDYNFTYEDEEWLKNNIALYEVVDGVLREKDESVVSIGVKAQTYLNNTDWYCSRLIETGLVIPIEVLEKRAEAREQVEEMYLLLEN